MILKIQAKKNNKFIVKVTIGNESYFVDNDFICIELMNSDFKMKVELINRNRKEAKLKYKFHLHEDNSKDFIQHTKSFSSYSAIYELKAHRDVEIVFDIIEKHFYNSFSSYDTYSEIRLIKKNNVKIVNVYKRNISNKDIKDTIIVDSILLMIRSILSIVICTLCCYATYYYRYEMKTIFQGEMIWVVISEYLLFLVLYLSSVFRRNFNYFMVLKDI